MHAWACVRAQAGVRASGRGVAARMHAGGQLSGPPPPRAPHRAMAHTHTQVESVNDDDWDIYWANISTIKIVFGSGGRLNEGQLINHFPNHFELTRKVRQRGACGWHARMLAPARTHVSARSPAPARTPCRGSTAHQDLMVKNIKRYQKQVKREGGSAAAQESLDIIPTTFVLPQVRAPHAPCTRAMHARHASALRSAPLPCTPSSAAGAPTLHHYCPPRPFHFAPRCLLHAAPLPPAPPSLHAPYLLHAPCPPRPRTMRCLWRSSGACPPPRGS